MDIIIYIYGKRDIIYDGVEGCGVMMGERRVGWVFM